MKLLTSRTVIRQPIQDLVDFGMPNRLEDLSEEELLYFDQLIGAIWPLEPLNNAEALFLANNFGKGELYGIATSLGGSIASAPFWPSDKILYINNFSDPLTDLKMETFLNGNLRYRFTSRSNANLRFVPSDFVYFNDEGINFDQEKMTILFMKLNMGINEIDLQMLLAIFQYIPYEDSDPHLINHLTPIVRDCLTIYSITRNILVEDGLLIATLESAFRITL